MLDAAPARGHRLTVVPPRPVAETKALLRIVEQLRPPPVRWWVVAEWLLPVALVALVSFIACQVTDRLTPAAWLFVGWVVAAALIRPVVVRRLPRSG